jgi:nitrite reductase/ring-hydroxylating ferredoxin subunit
MFTAISLKEYLEKMPEQGEIFSFVIEEKEIAIANHLGKYYAFNNKCPHASAPFTDGWLSAAGCVVCPLHGYKFSIKNGENVTGEGYRLKTYKLIEEEGDWKIVLI